MLTVSLSIVAMYPMKKLEFLIPSYKRPQTLVRAIQSITTQVKQFELADKVSIVVVDDCTPNFSCDDIRKQINILPEIVDIRTNTYNKGMSLNIRDMVFESSADFACILTDDDYLQPNILIDIINFIDNLTSYENNTNVQIGSFFVPRYSYLEDGSLHCVVCKPFEQDTLIPRGTINSIRYLHNGFILTGLFFKPKLINFSLWNENIENAFFPLIYFFDLLLKYDCFFINRNWFVHTVLNRCHWEAWGTTDYQRKIRLYTDYMKAITICTNISIDYDKRTTSTYIHYLKKIFILIEETKNYRNQIKSVIRSGLSLVDIKGVNDLTKQRLTFRLAVVISYIDLILFRFILKFIWNLRILTYGK
ncbi:glycosyltransferase [Thermosynechococcus sp. QKsg1]|uniref:glycosyltransferase family 2 protein n=1 Tax=Thermosynechococcus sp. QKsg1 TaxID=3074130 RepID=UPI002877449C|nr:glycosyltransferase [Thermosynechococcus sp. QKsg1]WNC86869.1 glycosyltransferase [Thermosynechococcus sp. QKsg1]